MAKQGMLAQLKALRRAEQHVLWLRANLPKHPITLRVERELLIRRTAVAVGAAVERALQNPRTAAKPNRPSQTNQTKALNHKSKERA